MTALGRETEEHLQLAMLIAVAGVVVVLLWGLFGLHDGSAARAPAALRADVEQALHASGYPGLEVRMHGQRALLFGVVASRDDIGAARSAALTAAGPGGQWAGGVTSVDVYGVHVGAVERPFAWRVVRDGSSVVLSGDAPSETARRTLLADASALFPNAVVADKMQVVGGAPSPRWSEVARDALAQLASLESGEAQLNDSEIVLIGGGSQTAINALNRHYQALPPPFRVRLQVSVQ